MSVQIVALDVAGGFEIVKDTIWAWERMLREREGSERYRTFPRGAGLRSVVGPSVRILHHRLHHLDIESNYCHPPPPSDFAELGANLGASGRSAHSRPKFHLCA